MVEVVTQNRKGRVTMAKIQQETLAGECGQRARRNCLDYHDDEAESSHVLQVKHRALPTRVLKMIHRRGAQQWSSPQHPMLFCFSSTSCPISAYAQLDVLVDFPGEN